MIPIDALNVDVNTPIKNHVDVVGLPVYRFKPCTTTITSLTASVIPTFVRSAGEKLWSQSFTTAWPSLTLNTQFNIHVMDGALFDAVSFQQGTNLTINSLDENHTE